VKIDYSPEAIGQRLRQASELRDVCLALAGPRLKWDWRRMPDAVPGVVKEQHAGNGSDQLRRRQDET